MIMEFGFYFKSKTKGVSKNETQLKKDSIFGGKLYER